MADHFHHFTNPSGVNSSADFEGFDRAETFDLAEFEGQKAGPR